MDWEGQHRLTVKDQNKLDFAHSIFGPSERDRIIPDDPVLAAVLYNAKYNR